jgi:DedD protein
MKFVFDERVKHRMIGLAVIISLAAIFAPAIMKKSNQRFDKEIGMGIQLPPKPILPKVAVTDHEKLFKTVKVAHVDLPAASSRQEPIQLAKIEHKIPLEAIANEVEKNFVAPIPVVEKVAVAKIVPVVIAKQTPVSVAKAVIIKKPLIVALNQEIFSVQLASFARIENAQVLVNRLRSKGYTGKIVKVLSKNGNQFKVYVGKSSNKEQALKLKNQLAEALQLRGFVVSGVG